MMVRSISVVTLAAVVGVGAAAQTPAPQSQQPPAVPSAAPTVQAGDTRPIHIYIRAGLKSHGERGTITRSSSRTGASCSPTRAHWSTARSTFRQPRSSPPPT